MTFVAAAVCPHPPLLLPEVGRGEPVAARAVAVDAVRRLVAACPDRIVVVGEAPAETRYGPTATGTLAGFGVDLTVPLGPPTAAAARPGPPELPLSLTVGAWLLAAAGWAGERSALGVPAAHSPREAADLGAGLAASSGPGERLGLLVMGDGSARRTLKAPGGLDERAAAFDAAAAAALAGADPAGLLDLDPGLATDLLAAGRASWQVLAGALRATTPCGAPHVSWQGDVTYDDAPYGVGYLVATWTRRPAEGGAPPA
ncbi:conserved hypothetical protein [Frankia canadensis]|uniref:Catalytic LigB subunit of aromatic ring-opening dioxygenase n=1 Tax=Frankia canadensis TaxID=1836972 RepID=A0A2I2KTT4_9ACTN|nr:hypothetical protein [Frankia canadensis]SNQ49059.1 conserved hypothetical protein [Frankia canadensis]SOU56349.1 conserved hypothetical protein [Frankia canadensis]